MLGCIAAEIIYDMMCFVIKFNEPKMCSVEN